MASPLLSHTVHKVDRAVERLQLLQSAVARKDTPVAGSGRNVRRQKGGGRDRDMRRFDELVQMDEDPENSGKNWRRWSSPAGFVHQMVSEILIANNFAKAVAETVADAIGHGGEPKITMPKTLAEHSHLTETPPQQQAIQEEERRERGFEGNENALSHEKRGAARRINGMTVAPMCVNEIQKQNYRMKTHTVQQRSEAGRKRRDDFPKKLSKCNTNVIQKETPRTVPRLRVATPLKVSDLDSEGELSSCFLSSVDSIEVQKAANSSNLVRSSLEKKCSSGLKSTSLKRQVSYNAPTKARPKTPSSFQTPWLVPSTKIPARGCLSCRATRVSASPESGFPAAELPIGKFSVRVAEVTTSTRPWSLTPSRPTKPVIMFPNPTFAPSLTPPKPSRPSPRPLQCLASKSSLSSKVMKLSPFKNLRLQHTKFTRSAGRQTGGSPGRKKSIPVTFSSPSKGVKLRSPDRKSPLGKKHQLHSSSLRQLGSGKKLTPVKSPRLTGSLFGKHQSWVSRRVSITPSKGILRLPLLGKQVSPAKPLPSLINRLPSRRNGIPGFQPSVEPPATQQSALCIGGQIVPRVMSPLPIPPALQAEKLRAAEMKNAFPSAENRKENIGNHPRQLRPVDANSTPIRGDWGKSDYICKGKENRGKETSQEQGRIDYSCTGKEIGDKGANDCAFPGCGTAVWPVLRRSWSIGKIRTF